MFNVALLSYPDIALFELACATELFMLPRPEIEHWYTTDLVTLDSPPAITGLGIGLTGARHVQTLKNYDMIVVSSWPPTKETIPENIQLALLSAHQQGKRILSFCSGAFLLAQLGLLDGRKATTHWHYAEKFKNDFPSVHYVGDVLYVYDGTIGTSAGSAAALDLGLAVIREDFGAAIANKVARRMVIPAHRNGGQSQFVESAVVKRPNLLAETLDWAVTNLSNIRSVNTLAHHAYMSRRTFDRKFRAAMGVSPQCWLIEQRLNLVRNLLENTKDNIDQIANNSGFDTAETLRHHFRKRLKLSPTKYREYFHQRHLTN